MNWLLEVFDENLPFTNPVVVFAIVMAIILIAPLFVRRIKIPGLIGIILAGAIIGPSALGLLDRDNTIELLGTVGLLYLMFTAGLSMDLNQFLRNRVRSFSFGLLTFLIPQMFAIAIGIYILDVGLLTALLIGSIVGSHTLLAYPIAKRLGITRNRAVTMTMGGTIVADTLALGVLAAVVAITLGEVSVGFWVQFVLMLLLYATVIIVGLPIVGRWFFRNVQSTGDADFVFLLVMLFASAVLSELVGLAPIIGAFLAGLTLNRLVPDNSPLMSRVQFVGDALFIPFFLLSVGMLVDFRVLFGSLELWGLALTFAALVLFGKMLAAKIAQWAFGYRSSEGWTMYGLTVPQAAATLAVTLIGFDQLQLFDEVAVNAVVLLILITCLIGPVVVERYGRQIALESEQEEVEIDTTQRIMVPLANPANAPGLMDIALMIRSADSNEPIYPLTVARDGPDVQAQVSSGEKILSHAVLHATAAGVPVLPVTRVDLNIANGIHRAVRERRISTLVIGWNGVVTTRQRFLGSILDQLIQNTRQLVMICRLIETPVNTTNRIVLVVPRFAEREPGFADAVKQVKRLAKQLGTRIALVTPQVAAERVREAVEAIKPKVSVESVSLATWSQLTSTLDDEVENDDMIVLMSSRSGRISWTADNARLPQRLSARFERHHVVMVYPSEILRAREARTPSQSHLYFDVNRIVLDIDCDHLDDVVREILYSAFEGEAGVRESLRQTLMRNVEQFAMELAPGMVLLHRHVPYVKEPQVFLGRSVTGIRVPGIQEPAQLLIVLLSPADAPPEEHLQALSVIAKSLSRADQVERILTARKPDDVMTLVADAADSA